MLSVTADRADIVCRCDAGWKQTDLALATLATRTAAGLGIGVLISAILFKSGLSESLPCCWSRLDVYVDVFLSLFLSPGRTGPIYFLTGAGFGELASILGRNERMLKYTHTTQVLATQTLSASSIPLLFQVRGGWLALRFSARIIVLDLTIKPPHSTGYKVANLSSQSSSTASSIPNSLSTPSATQAKMV